VDIIFMSGWLFIGDFPDLLHLRKTCTRTCAKNCIPSPRAALGKKLGPRAGVL
jgi:hypothetical protein